MVSIPSLLRQVGQVGESIYREREGALVGEAVDVSIAELSVLHVVVIPAITLDGVGGHLALVT